NFGSNSAPSLIAGSATNQIKISGQQPAEPSPATKVEPKPSQPATQNLAALPPSPSVSNASAPSTTLPPPTPPVAATTPAPASNRAIFLIAGLVLIAAVAGFAVLRLRRPKSPQTASLITRSLEREKEP